jgi:sister chromatid cohesion protein PDS5
LSGKTETTKFINDKLCLIIYELNHIRPSLLELVLPQLEYKLKSCDLKERREFTKILSKMFSESDSKLAQQVPQLWEAYLERFSDESDDIRKICAQTVGDFLINHTELKSKIEAMANGLSLDADEYIRIEMIQEIFRAMKLDISLIEPRLLSILKDRCMDIRPRVRKLVLQGLGSLYKKIHASIKNRELFDKIEWLPMKILRAHYLESSEDKLLIERLLNSSLVPYGLPNNERMIQLYYVFSTLNDDASIISLLEIIRERIFLNYSMKLIIDALDEGKDEQSDTIKKQIDFISSRF